MPEHTKMGTVQIHPASLDSFTTSNDFKAFVSGKMFGGYIIYKRGISEYKGT